MKNLSILILPVLFFIFLNPADAQVQKWYQEDFSNGTGGWSEPGKSPNPPIIVGEGNMYLQNASTGGNGAGSKWVMINSSAAWTGNYNDSGVKYIFLDVRHNGASPLNLRLAFSNDDGGTYVNTKAVIVNPGEEWETIWWSIKDDDITANEGGNKEDIMGSVSVVRLISSPDPGWQGETIETTVEIDNIRMTGDINYKSYLTGENQLPGVETSGRGELYLEQENDTITVWGEIAGIQSGIDSTVAGGMHIHSGMAGQNGGVVFPLKANFLDGATAAQLDPANNRFTLTAEQKDILEDHGFYINVHSVDFRGGEIRGQILDADDALYRSNLHGSNQTPAIMSPAEGRIVMTVDSNMLRLSGSFQNLSSAVAVNLAGGGHIHMELPGANGGVEIPLNIQVDSTETSGVLLADSNEYVLTADQVNAIRERKLYINIHSLNHSGGEIRGQIVSAASLKLFRAYLSGTNEVPMVTSSALGTVNIELLSKDSILVFGTYGNLESPLNTSIAGGIHLHGGMAGENAGVLFPLQNTQGSDRNGRLEPRRYRLDSTMYELIMNRSTYINIHTEAHGSGEIRGQVLSDAPWHFTAPMTSSQQISSAVSTGYGALKGEWNGRQLILSGVIQNLSSPIATAIAGGGHIHLGMPGQNGGVIIPLNQDISEDGMNTRLQADSNVYVLADSVSSALIRRGLYANIHTGNYRSGEVRGQLLFDAAMYGAAVFGGSLENPPVNTTGKGLVLLEMNPLSMKMVGTVSSLMSPIDTSILGGAHLHNAYAGRNGPVVMPIKLVPSDNMLAGHIPIMDNHYETTEPGLNVLALRRGYLNVHTTEHRTGEIRGQILPLSSFYLIANLNGHNEAPPVDSSGMGTAVIEVNGTNVVLSGTFNNLTAKVATNIAGGAHIHQAPAGSNGSVLIPLRINLSADSLSGEFMADSNTVSTGNNPLLPLLQSGLYVNIHSENHRGGEVRGQLLPMINYFPDASEVSFTSSDEIILDTTDMDTRVVFEWTPAIDEDDVVYQLIWASDSTFDTVLYRSSYTSEPRVAVVDSVLLDTLMSMGYFADSDTACIMMRLRATDGSLSDGSPMQEVCFVMGIRTNRQDPLQSRVQISPVPATNEITISIKNYEAFRNQPNVKASIFNTTGQLVKRQNFSLFGSEHRETIDISSLPTGQYFLQLNKAVWSFIKL